MLSSGSSVKTEVMSEEEDSDATDQPGLSSDREDIMDEDMDVREPTCAMENDEETEQMNGPTEGEAHTAGVMERS